MNKSTRSNGRRSIKGLIPPVANTRRHRELISPNRGNKREAAPLAGGRSSVRVVRWISRIQRWTGRLVLGVERVLRPCQGERPPFIRLVRCGSAANEKLVRGRWKGRKLTRGGGWGIGEPTRRTVSWFGIFPLCQDDHWKGSSRLLPAFPSSSSSSYRQRDWISEI